MKMDFVQTLIRSNENIVNYFKDRVDPLEKEQRDNFKNIVESLEQKFNVLLSDEVVNQPEFLIPDLPKFKKEVKGKRKQKASKVSSTSSQEAMRSARTTTCGDTSIDSLNSDGLVRKSSRLASKASQIHKQETPDTIQTLPNDGIVCNETFVTVPNLMLPAQLEPSVILSSKKQSSKFINEDSTVGDCAKSNVKLTKESISEPPSPSTPPTKIRCIENVNFAKTNISRNILHESFSGSIKDEPLGSSTPTNTQPGTVKVQHTPKQLDTARRQKMKTNIYTEQSISAQKGSRTRNQDKILQEKNINIKMIEEKCQEAQKKKEDIIKSSAEEAKRKREERARKVAASREATLQEKIKLIRKQEIEKEMKLNQIEKQKDEKLRLELQKKKHLAAIKQAEIEKRRKEEENAKLLKLKKTDSKSEPVDEYAIDDVLESGSSDEEERPKKKVPSWATKENRKRPLLIQGYLDKKETVRLWFFNPSLKYPKLETLFAGVNLKNRPRASSAFWNTMIDFEEAFPLHD